MWRVYDVEGSTKSIKPYATRFWQKRFYHDGQGNSEIFANVWEYPPFNLDLNPNNSYTLEIDIPDELSPTKMYLRIESFSYPKIDIDIWDEDIRKILTEMFPWIRKELD